MRFLALVLFLFLMACQEQNPSSVLEDAPEAKLIVAEKIMSAEERALQNKIAVRALLQEAIDENATWQKEELLYECSTTTGGLLTITKTETELKGIRFGNNQEQKSEFINLYYNNNELNFVVYEKGEWLGEEEKMIQTIFYLDNGEVFHCLQKIVKGNSDTIEQLIKAAEYQKISIDIALFNYILKQEALFKEVTPANIAKYFCE